jgi:hypothetical protein
MITDPILAEAQSMEQVEIKGAADQYQQADAAETMQPVFSGDQVASSELF